MDDAKSSPESDAKSNSWLEEKGQLEPEPERSVVTVNFKFKFKLKLSCSTDYYVM
jgi:hypothetical protein